MRDEPNALQKTTRFRVWDGGVRIVHWSLVIAVGTALVLGFLGPKRLLDWHVWAGYTAAALVAFRVIWGFSGTTFARFSTFPPSIASVRGHLSGRHAPGYGHNPLGALMVYALLAIVLALAVTGLLTLGGVVRQGPLAAWVSYAAGRSIKESHEWLGWGMLALVALHIGGVILESVRERENLARAMATGWKRRRDDLPGSGTAVSPPAWWATSLPRDAPPPGTTSFANPEPPPARLEDKIAEGCQPPLMASAR